jgi:hypothetical protein
MLAASVGGIAQRRKLSLPIRDAYLPFSRLAWPASTRITGNTAATTPRIGEVDDIGGIPTFAS